MENNPKQVSVRTCEVKANVKSCNPLPTLRIHMSGKDQKEEKKDRSPHMNSNHQFGWAVHYKFI